MIVSKLLALLPILKMSCLQKGLVFQISVNLENMPSFTVWDKKNNKKIKSTFEKLLET